MLSTIKLHCDFSHDKLTDLLRPRIAGLQIGDELTVLDVALKGDDEWLYAVLSVSGRYNGNVHIRYQLKFDSNARRFVLEKLKVKISEKGILAKGANWLMQTFFAQKLDRRLEQMLNEKFHRLMTDLLTKYSYLRLNNGIQVFSELEEFSFDNIRWDVRALYFEATVRGMFKIKS